MKPPNVNTYLQEQMNEYFLKKEEDRAKNRKRSGKLSASLLGQPLLWQLLHVWGVDDAKEDYVYGKFERGNQIEKFVTQFLKGEKQKFIEYKECIGYADNVDGIIPDEVKSVTSHKFKRVWKEKNADISHRLQATLYALGLNSNVYFIHYINADDLRTYSLEYDIEETAPMVEKEIEEFNKWYSAKKLPIFTSKIDWHNNERYMKYKDWCKLNENDLNKKFEQYLKT